MKYQLYLGSALKLYLFIIFCIALTGKAYLILSKHKYERDALHAKKYFSVHRVACKTKSRFLGFFEDQFIKDNNCICSFDIRHVVKINYYHPSQFSLQAEPEPEGARLKHDKSQEGKIDSDQFLVDLIKTVGADLLIEPGVLEIRNGVLIAYQSHKNLLLILEFIESY